MLCCKKKPRPEPPPPPPEEPPLRSYPYPLMDDKTLFRSLRQRKGVETIASPANTLTHPVAEVPEISHRPQTRSHTCLRKSAKKNLVVSC